LLEVGSTIKRINVQEGCPDEPVSLTTSSEWFESQIEQQFCFGCKRMAISASNKSLFLESLPKIIKHNAIVAMQGSL